MSRSSKQEELWALVKQIPRGRVASYGALGSALPNRVPAILIGKWMFQCPASVPWWRVVGADGHFPLAKRDPALGLKQKALLVQEGVKMNTEDQISPETFFFDFV